MGGEFGGGVADGNEGREFFRTVLRFFGRNRLISVMLLPKSLLLLLGLPAAAVACIQGYHLPPVESDFVPAVVRPERVKPNLDFPPITLAPSDVKLARPSITFNVPLTELQAQQAYRQIVADYQAKPAGTATVEETTDYAAALVFMRRAEAAIPVLVALEHDHPGRYATAANLGTAYELTGDLPNALKWISEGIARDASSHEGTEWLHVAILEAKLRLQQDASWLAARSVLDTVPARPAEETVHAIEHQLSERLRFVTPADPVVCDLFYQAALRVTGLGPEAAERRAELLKESLRFGDLRKAAIATLQKS